MDLINFIIDVRDWVQEDISTCQLNPVGIWVLLEIFGKISILHVTRHNEGGIQSQGSAIKRKHVIVVKCAPYPSFIQNHLDVPNQIK
jgi:hypothetical protein